MFLISSFLFSLSIISLYYYNYCYVLSVNYIKDYHYSMLNDNNRNEAFNNALKKYISNDSIVIDVGSGTMLLSMISSRYGAIYVLGIEKDQLLCDISKEILQLNNFTDSKKIQLFEGELIDLRIGSSYLKKPADILVSETLDPVIVGEGLLNIIVDAKFQNLLKPNATIIPNYGKLFIQLADTKASVPINKDIFGFNITPIHKYRRTNYEYINDIYSSQFNSFLSDPVVVTSYDFQNLEDDDLFRYKTIFIPIIKSGNLNSVVFWFEVALDRERTIILSNSPDSNSHWSQKIYELLSDKLVNENDYVGLQIVITDSNIFIGSIEDNARLFKVVSTCPQSLSIYGSYIDSYVYKSDDINEGLYYIGRLFGTDDEEYNIFQGYINQNITIRYYNTNETISKFIIPNNINNQSDSYINKLPPLYSYRINCD